MSKVYTFLANGFEEVECLAVVDILRRANIDVTMVSITNNKYVTGSHSITVQADALFKMQISQMLIFSFCREVCREQNTLPRTKVLPL